MAREEWRKIEGGGPGWELKVGGVPEKGGRDGVSFWPRDLTQVERTF